MWFTGCLHSPWGKSSLTRIGLYGLPGVGKSTVLAKLIHEKTLKDAYGQEIYWVNVHQQTRVSDIVKELLSRMGCPQPDDTSHDQLIHSFRRGLAERQSLIVLDDIWKDDQLDPLKELAGPSCVVALSRNKELLEHSFGEEKVSSLQSKRFLAALDQHFLAHLLGIWMRLP